VSAAIVSMDDRKPAAPKSMVAAVVLAASGDGRPCPKCSLFSANVFRFPSVGQGRASGRWFVRSGCHHAVRLPDPEGKGSFSSKEEFLRLWEAEVDRLATERENEFMRSEARAREAREE
jgi:hypothetical protein